MSHEVQSQSRDLLKFICTDYSNHLGCYCDPPNYQKEITNPVAFNPHHAVSVCPDIGPFLRQLALIFRNDFPFSETENVIHCLDISQTGGRVITVGKDLKVRLYDEVSMQVTHDSSYVTRNYPNLESWRSEALSLSFLVVLLAFKYFEF